MRLGARSPDSAQQHLILTHNGQLERMKNTAHLLPFIALLMLSLTACSNNPKEDPYENSTAQQIYQEAHAKLEEDEYKKSAEVFEALEAHYPFGDYTKQGQLEIVYSYYKADESPAALAAAERYIRLHPRSEQLDYAYYLKGLIKFNENKGLLSGFLPLDPSKRDLTADRASYHFFEEFVRRYSNSPYAADARQRMAYLRNEFAQAQYHQADYYYRRGAYLAAANRASDIVKNFEGATIMPDALVLVVKAYHKLGLEDLAADAERVLALNYPEKDAALLEEEKTSKWYWF